MPAEAPPTLLPRRAGLTSPGSRYPGWGAVTRGVAHFPRWSVQIRVGSPVSIAPWDVERRPLSPGARSPLGFCRAARGWSRARLSYLFSQCSFGIFATIARIIPYKLTGNSLIVGQGLFLKATNPRQLLTLASQTSFRGIFSLARQLCRIYTGSRFSTPRTTGGGALRMPRVSWKYRFQ